MRTSRSIRTIILLTGLCCGRAVADDWPQWLGPGRDGVWRETGIVSEFPETGPPLRWKTPIGGGYTGPSVADGRVLLMDRVPEPVSGEPKFLHKGEVPRNKNFVRQLLPGKERVVCLREEDGTVLWTHEYNCPYSTVATYAIGPRATPTMDGERVYTLGAEGNLLCLRVEDGRVVWSKDFKRDYEVEVPNWGFASPPLVDGDRLICIVGGPGTTCVAFDKRTGREQWRTLSAKEPGYSAPVIRRIGGERQLLVWDSDQVHGLNPDNGERYWSVKFPSTFAMSVSTPQIDGRSLFVMCFNGKCAMITIDDDGRSAELAWQGNRRRGIDGVHNTPILLDGHIYGCGNGGRYVCARLSDGERLWSTFAPASSVRPVSWGNVFTIRHKERDARPSTVRGTQGSAGSKSDQHVGVTKPGSAWLLANDHGELIIARMSPEGYSETSRAKLIEPTHQVGNRKLVWSHPAFANRSVYLRNDREIRCYSLAASDRSP